MSLGRFLPELVLDTDRILRRLHLRVERGGDGFGRTRRTDHTELLDDHAVLRELVIDPLPDSEHELFALDAHVLLGTIERADIIEVITRHIPQEPVREGLQIVRPELHVERRDLGRVEVPRDRKVDRDGEAVLVREDDLLVVRTTLLRVVRPDRGLDEGWVLEDILRGRIVPDDAGLGGIVLHPLFRPHLVDHDAHVTGLDARASAHHADGRDDERDTQVLLEILEPAGRRFATARQPERHDDHDEREPEQHLDVALGAQETERPVHTDERREQRERPHHKLRLHLFSSFFPCLPFG